MAESTINPNAINSAWPQQGNASTSNVRANFAAAKAQFEAAKADIEAIEVGDPNPELMSNVMVVAHGSNANVARPDFPFVIWIGTVEPTNGEVNDLLFGPSGS